MVPTARGRHPDVMASCPPSRPLYFEIILLDTESNFLEDDHTGAWSFGNEGQGGSDERNTDSPSHCRRLLDVARRLQGGRDDPRPAWLHRRAGLPVARRQ